MDFIGLYRKKSVIAPTAPVDMMKRFTLFASEIALLLEQKNARIAELTAQLNKAEPQKARPPCIIINHSR